MKKVYVSLTIVSFIIGFMLFVQYNTIQNPTERDTKDIWEIRNELSEEQKRHSKLLTSITDMKARISQYEQNNNESPDQILQQTMDELYVQSGQAPVTGPGFTITVKPSEETIQFGYEVEEIPPMLLIRLVNELNRNGAMYLEIGGQRVTLWTAIRDINGRTTVNGRAIGKTGTEIKVISRNEEQAQKLYNYVLASSLMDEFFIDNLKLNVSEVTSKITIASTFDLMDSTYLNVYE